MTVVEIQEGLKYWINYGSNCGFYDWLKSAHPEACINGQSPASFHM